MKRNCLIALAALIAIAAPVFALENEQEAPAAFVEGTKEYTINYFDRIRAALSEHFTRDELASFDKTLVELKEKNVHLLEHIAALRGRKMFLGEKDAKLLQYRRALAQTTDLMFGLIQKLNASALPSR